MTMTRFSPVLILAAGCLGAAAAVAAPKAMAEVAGGYWELEGLPGKRSAVKQCAADPLKLASVEHGAAKCTETVLSEAGSTVRLSIQCAGGGFGQATVKVVTPRSLRIDVQGIADGAPYGYVIQARRTGECPAPAGKPERGAH